MKKCATKRLETGDREDNVLADTCESENRNSMETSLYFDRKRKEISFSVQPNRELGTIKNRDRPWHFAAKDNPGPSSLYLNRFGIIDAPEILFPFPDSDRLFPGFRHRRLAFQTLRVLRLWHRPEDPGQPGLSMSPS